MLLLIINGRALCAHSQSFMFKYILSHVGCKVPQCFIFLTFCLLSEFIVSVDQWLGLNIKGFIESHLMIGF